MGLAVIHGQLLLFTPHGYRCSVEDSNCKRLCTHTVTVDLLPICLLLLSRFVFLDAMFSWATWLMRRKQHKPLMMRVGYIRVTSVGLMRCRHVLNMLQEYVMYKNSCSTYAHLLRPRLHGHVFTLHSEIRFI